MMPVFVWTVSNSSDIIVGGKYIITTPRSPAFRMYEYTIIKGVGRLGLVWWLGLTPLNFDCPILGAGVGILGAQWGAGSLLVITAPP